ncbi:histidine phosphatase superfamily [Suillus ampliporus]|nr:histidine phosphatase superfamily [Suillus ampliporus]
MLAGVLLFALPFCSAESVSSYAGSTVVASYPPPGATNTAIDSYFPDASQVGNAGPTPTGAEPEAIVTAIPFSKLEDAFPLSSPNSADGADATFNKDVVSTQCISSCATALAIQPLAPDLLNLLLQFILLHRTNGVSVTGDLEFLATWTYKLGGEILTPFGREALFRNGVAFRYRYGELLNGFTDLPVFRTTSEDRMVDSALNFAAGFFDVRTYQTDYHQEIISEALNFNNSLAPWNVCPNANTDDIGYFGDGQASKWANVYLQGALSRLQPMIQGFNLTISDLVNMQEMCAYETVALGFSKFCDLFTEEEWEGYEYYVDLSFWYSGGPGNPTAAAQGLGYVQELVARLTQTPITVWNSSTNSTLDSSKITFPLDQPIYVDATHDIVIANIVTALNLTSLAANGPLPTDHIPLNRSYIVSQIIPFASQLVAQVLSCPASGESSHIRLILNDGVVPLTGIHGCTENADGLCALPSFISGMHERIGEINFAYDCFANYTMPNPDNIIDGRYPG